MPESSKKDGPTDVRKPEPPEKSKTEELPDSGKMTVIQHLAELRKRLIISVVAYVISVLACYGFATKLFALLKRPLEPVIKEHPGSTFAIHTLTEGFLVELKVAAIAGLFVASPVLFLQIWKFVSPGLYKHERRLAFPIIFFSTVLFSTGAVFGYFGVFPFVFGFFLSYTGADTSAFLSINEYLGFAAKLLAGFGLVFELPLVIFVLAYLGIVDHHRLRKIRRYVIVAAFALAAVITPPDVISQVFVAIPLILLYEVGIIIALVVGRKRRTDEEVEGRKARG